MNKLQINELQQQLERRDEYIASLEAKIKNKNREVSVYEMRRSSGKSLFEKIFVGSGVFLQFGLDEDDGGSYSTAIVEMPDGHIENVGLDMIIFNDKIRETNET